MKETIANINTTKLVLLENKQNWQTFSQIHQEKREKKQINKIRNETGQFTTDYAEKQRIIRDYYDQLMAIKWITWKKWTDS